MDIGKLALALCKAQSQFAPLNKTKTAEVLMKSGGKYSYKYADLSDLIEATKHSLAANELAIIQTISGSVLKTILAHSSGEFVESFYDLPNPLNLKAQEYGSALTYARRYSYQAIVGVAADEDEDGALANATGPLKNSQGAKPAQSKAKEEPPKQDLGPEQKYRDGLMKALSNIIKSHNIQKVVLEKYVLELTGSNKASKDLSNEELEALILKLEASFEGGV